MTDKCNHSICSEHQLLDDECDNCKITFPENHDYKFITVRDLKWMLNAMDDEWLIRGDGKAYAVFHMGEYKGSLDFLAKKFHKVDYD